MVLPNEGTRIAGIPFEKRRSGKVFEFIVYPDSAPADWVDLVAQTGVEFAVSPLHNADISANGEHKKDHYHMIAVWPNNTKWQTATVLCDIVNGPICIPVIDIRPKYDYLTHKNDPNKAQYNPDDIQHCNGFVLSKYLNLTAAEVSQKVAEITKLCFEFQFYEYADLIKYLLDNDMFDDFDIASNRTLYFSNLIKGIWRKGGQPQKVDFRTGELLNDDNGKE